MDIKRTEDNELLGTMPELEPENAKKEEIKNIITVNQNDKPQEKQEKANGTVPDNNDRTLSIGDWMLVIFVFLIPVINIIFMAVWAFSSEGNVHRRNFARASLLWLIILLASYAVAMAIAGFTIINLFG